MSPQPIAGPARVLFEVSDDLDHIFSLGIWTSHAELHGALRTAVACIEKRNFGHKNEPTAVKPGTIRKSAEDIAATFRREH